VVCRCSIHRRRSINKLISRLRERSISRQWLARAGAFTRYLKDQDCAELLHLGWPMRRRAVAARRGRLGDAARAALSNVAVLKRLRLPAVATWLQEMIAAILAQRQPARPPRAWHVRVIDRRVSSPGKAADHRLHASYDLASQQLVAIMLSGTSESESLRHFAIGPGEIALADRGYLRPATSARCARRAATSWCAPAGTRALA